MLDELAELGHVLPQKILEWRQVTKLKSTYTDALPGYINPTTKRVHTNYALAATPTGRLSSSEPNLQNIPVRTEEGRKIRRAFVAAPGHKLASADYSQIELRLLAEIGNVELLRKAFRDGLDIHAMTASEMFGVPVKGMPGEIRRRAKAINFGIIYGISAFGLANQLGIEREEAGAYIKKYFERFPGIRDYMEETKAFAKQHGYVTTLFGRKCHYPEIKHSNASIRAFNERAAINARLQGSAADIIRRAMVRMDAALAKKKLNAQMLLQVHDELVFEVPEDEVDKTLPVVKAVMEDAPHPAVSLSVPLRSTRAPPTIGTRRIDPSSIAWRCQRRSSVCCRIERGRSAYDCMTESCNLIRVRMQRSRSFDLSHDCPDAAHAAALDGAALRWPWALPFIGILLTIATGPLLFPRLWHHHYGKLAFIWGALAIVPIAALYDVPTATAAFVHALLGEYLSFIVLLFTLYVVAGGILVTGDLRGTPLVNTAILAFGTLIASIVGTTGAAMILIRPLLRANANRLHNAHVVVFFIILVANVGGALTPARRSAAVRRLPARRRVSSGRRNTCGCRPRSWPASCFVIFVVVDVWFYRQDRRVTVIGEPPPPPARLRVQGSVNFLLIGGVIATILLTSQWKPGIVFDIVRHQGRAAGAAARRHAHHDRACSRSCSRPTSTARPTASPGSRSARSRSCSPASSPASFRCWRCCRPAATGAFGWLPQLIERQRLPQRGRAISGSRASFRPSSTMRRPISCSSSWPAAMRRR